MPEPITKQAAAIPEWPNVGLDVESLKAQGWQPAPFRQFVLKVHSRCNLACDYCYMYELADQSWQGRPAAMSKDTVVAAARRIADHAAGHHLRSVQVVLHGGEPLLAGAELIEFIVKELRAAIDPSVDVKLGIQTNGALLNDAILGLLLHHGIRVGISLDGDQAANDRHRRYRGGSGSYERVREGINRLSEERYRCLFSGLLAVVDVSNDPASTYEHLAQFRPPEIDFVLPHATWANPPSGKEPDSAGTPYADWLIAAFDHWYRAGAQRVDVRLFRSVIRLALGWSGNSEAVGLQPITFLVIETDGFIEQVDVLKAAYAGAPETGLHVLRDDLDSVLDHPGIVARQIGARALCQTCLECSVRDICGAGLYAHRYRPGSGFLNPSVYCTDLLKFIKHVSVQVDADLTRIRRA